MKRPDYAIATLGQIKDVLSYDPATGVFLWTKTFGRVAVQGQPAGVIHRKGYVRIHIFGRQYFAHRLAFLFTYGVWPDQYIDHKNGIRHDNRLSNLRQVTNQQNCENQKNGRRHGRSGLIGAHYHNQTGRWIASIVKHGKRISLGLFNSPEEAHRAYLEAKRNIHPYAVFAE